MINKLILTIMVAWLLFSVTPITAGKIRPSYISEAQKDAQASPSISICQLLSSPELYDGKTVRIKTIFYSNMEYAYFYDPDCSSEDHFVNPIFHCDDDQSCFRMQQENGKIFEEGRYGARAEIVALGRFDVNEKGTPYGSLLFKSSFSVIKIEQHAHVSPETPWPGGQRGSLQKE